MYPEVLLYKGLIYAEGHIQWDILVYLCTYSKAEANNSCIIMKFPDVCFIGVKGDSD